MGTLLIYAGLLLLLAGFSRSRAPAFLRIHDRREAAAVFADGLTTETRVFATDSRARRRFAVYWRVIYPGSALIRRSWLDAIKRRAENPTS